MRHQQRDLSNQQCKSAAKQLRHEWIDSRLDRNRREAAVIATNPDKKARNLQDRCLADQRHHQVIRGQVGGYHRQQWRLMHEAVCHASL